jgi:hypothetical protein
LSVKQNCKVVDHFDVVAQSGVAAMLAILLQQLRPGQRNCPLPHPGNTMGIIKVIK